MIRINQLKLPVTHTPGDLRDKAAAVLRIPAAEIGSLRVVRRSLDARRKDQIRYIYCVEVTVKSRSETALLHKRKSPDIVKAAERAYKFPAPGSQVLKERPLIIGSGPAGLFCGLMLARNGYAPLILERGEDVDARTASVAAFWNGGPLKPDSNVQFGEGGAGTFSDGKLNTLVKDPLLRGQKVLEIFAEFGADPEILYDSRPHVGTDALCRIVKNIRLEIERLGGTLRFRSRVTDIVVRDGRLEAVVVNGRERVNAQIAVAAIGHSARDTFEMLCERGVPMEQKSFAVGLRIQHPQAMINRSQYGEEDAGLLGAAAYKLTGRTAGGRGVYSFCMCPGGYVVDASSEPGRLAVNGMSNHAREGGNANSALIVSVTPGDYPGDSPLAGVAYQRSLEEAAFRCGGGKIPVQLYGDFRAGRDSRGFGEVGPEFKGLFRFGNLREILPEYVYTGLVEGIESFGERIAGFNRPDAVLAGIESRTSSPVRILRGENFESAVAGIYPCGEGAGYAGGITSAAMDGIKIAEAVAKRFSPPGR